MASKFPIGIQSMDDDLSKVKLSEEARLWIVKKISGGTISASQMCAKFNLRLNTVLEWKKKVAYNISTIIPRGRPVLLDEEACLKLKKFCDEKEV